MTDTEKLHDLWSSPSTEEYQLSKSRKGWLCQLACLGEMKLESKILLGKLEGMRSLEKNGCARPRAEIVQSVLSVGHGLDNRGTVVRFPPFSKASKQPLGPTEPPIQWLPGALPPELKQPTNEADRSLPSTVEVKN
jgi:hypothetical protein